MDHDIDYATQANIHREAALQRKTRTIVAAQNEEEEEEPQAVAVPSQMMMVIDLTNDTNWQPSNEDIEGVVVTHDQPKRRGRKRKEVPVLPLQDAVFLIDAEEEFREEIPVPVNRRERRQGVSKETAIILPGENECIACRCTVRCISGFLCYANRHIVCSNSILKRNNMNRANDECPICLSRVM